MIKNSKFESKIKITLRETDAYSILFFPNQFEFGHRIYQEFLEYSKIPLDVDRESADHIAVVRSTCGEYLKPVKLNDTIFTSAYTTDIKNSSFCFNVDFSKCFIGECNPFPIVGFVKIRFVCINPKTANPIKIPEKLYVALKEIEKVDGEIKNEKI
jgi:acyl-CoA thioesterase FadM